MSHFSWLDYSEHERRQVLEVVDLFRAEDTRDELGLGTIRDALADLLFPGTSTIQTRLRYFLFVPWVMQQLEQRRTPSADMSRRSRQVQWQLCQALRESDDPAGVIGRRAGRHVQRLPSSVYWHGLARWGMRLYNGSEEGYRHSLDGFYQRQRHRPRGDDGEPVDGQPLSNWDPAIPTPPDEFPAEVDFALTFAEADYLADRIRRRAPDSLLRELIDHGVPAENDVRFAWNHPVASHLDGQLAERLIHARHFSELMHGAALLYNLMLAEDGEYDAYVEHYHEQLTLWWNAMIARWDAFEAWETARFWQVVTVDGGARVTPMTRLFVDNWIARVKPARQLNHLIDAPAVRTLIREREARLKGGRARLGNRRMLETWSGASGTSQLDYRWTRPVRGFVNDLIAGLHEEDGDA